jgi:hypothetical protein
LLFAKIKYVRNEKSLRQTKRQTQRQTDRKSERETNRLKGRQTEADKQRQTQTEKQTGRKTDDRQTDRRERQGPICTIPYIKNHGIFGNAA